MVLSCYVCMLYTKYSESVSLPLSLTLRKIDGVVTFIISMQMWDPLLWLCFMLNDGFFVSWLCRTTFQQQLRIVEEKKFVKNTFVLSQMIGIYIHTHTYISIHIFIYIHQPAATTKNTCKRFQLRPCAKKQKEKHTRELN